MMPNEVEAKIKASQRNEPAEVARQSTPPMPPPGDPGFWKAASRAGASRGTAFTRAKEKNCDCHCSSRAEATLEDASECFDEECRLLIQQRLRVIDSNLRRLLEGCPDESQNQTRCRLMLMLEQIHRFPADRTAGAKLALLHQSYLALRLAFGQDHNAVVNEVGKSLRELCVDLRQCKAGNHFARFALVTMQAAASQLAKASCDALNCFQTYVHALQTGDDLQAQIRQFAAALGELKRLGTTVEEAAARATTEVCTPGDYTCLLQLSGEICTQLTKAQCLLSEAECGGLDMPVREILVRAMQRVGFQVAAIVDASRNLVSEELDPVELLITALEVMTGQGEMLATALNKSALPCAQADPCASDVADMLGHFQTAWELSKRLCLDDIDAEEIEEIEGQLSDANRVLAHLSERYKVFAPDTANSKEITVSCYPVPDLIAGFGDRLPEAFCLTASLKKTAHSSAALVPLPRARSARENVRTPSTSRLSASLAELHNGIDRVVASVSKTQSKELTTIFEPVRKMITAERDFVEQQSKLQVPAELKLRRLHIVGLAIATQSDLAFNRAHTAVQDEGDRKILRRAHQSFKTHRDRFLKLAASGNTSVECREEGVQV